MTSRRKWHVSNWNVKSSTNWFQALCCSSSLASLSSQSGGASDMHAFDVQMLWTRIVMWTGRTHVLAAQVHETSISSV